jgi:hypothetical protein
MSYAALSLLDNNIEALLKPDTLYKTSNFVFSTFFQHFVTDNTTQRSGSYGFQSINATVPSTMKECTESPCQDYDTITHHLSSTIKATLHIRIQQLHMSPAAVYLCLSILTFLVATTGWVYTRHRRYFKALPRDVDTIASVLGFVYASPRLQRWVNDHKDQPHWGLHDDASEVRCSMRWFSPDHWGIELLDEVGKRQPDDRDEFELDARESQALI